MQISPKSVICNHTSVQIQTDISPAIHKRNTILGGGGRVAFLPYWKATLAVYMFIKNNILIVPRKVWKTKWNCNLDCKMETGAPFCTCYVTHPCFNSKSDGLRRPLLQTVEGSSQSAVLCIYSLCNNLSCTGSQSTVYQLNEEEWLLF